MKYSGWCETCLPLPQQDCGDCDMDSRPDGYISMEDVMSEQWPGWCAECNNRNTLSCDDCGGVKFVEGPDLWMPRDRSNDSPEDERKRLLQLVGDMRAALSKLELVLVRAK